MENNKKSLNLNDPFISPCLSMPFLDCDDYLYDLEYCGEKIKIKNDGSKNTRKCKDLNNSKNEKKKYSLSEHSLAVKEENTGSLSEHSLVIKEEKKDSFSEDSLVFNEENNDRFFEHPLVIDEDYVEIETAEEKNYISNKKNNVKTQQTNIIKLEGLNYNIKNNHKKSLPEKSLVIEEPNTKQENANNLPKKNIFGTQFTNFSIENLLSNTNTIVEKNKPKCFDKENVNPGPSKDKSNPEKRLNYLEKKKKNKYINFNQHQLKILHEAFSKSAYPSLVTIIQLSKMLNLEEDMIKIWFQRSRYAVTKGVKITKIPIPVQNQQFPVQNQQVSVQNQQVTELNQQFPIPNQQAQACIPSYQLSRNIPSPYGLNSFPIPKTLLGFPHMSSRESVQMGAIKCATDILTSFQIPFSVDVDILIGQDKSSSPVQKQL